MSGPYKDDDDEKPLDPAVEKVRQRLVRFVAINLGLLFLALMAVVVAIVYRASQPSEPELADASELPSPADGTVIEDVIDLPAGARVAGHSLSGARLSVLADMPDGSRTIVVYDMAERRIIARLAVGTGG